MSFKEIPHVKVFLKDNSKDCYIANQLEYEKLLNALENPAGKLVEFSGFWGDTIHVRDTEIESLDYWSLAALEAHKIEQEEEKLKDATS